MNIANIMLALIGFAPTDVQTKYPPVLAWLSLAVVCYGAAWIIEFASRLMPVLSVYFRAVGVFAVALLVQGTLRAIFFRDDLSWSGWLRKVVAK